MTILTLNAGSSSIKYKIFEHTSKQLMPFISGIIEAIGESKSQWTHQEDTQTLEITDHMQAMNLLTAKLAVELKQISITGIAHRVVHGGTVFHKPSLITHEVLAKLEQLIPLAPLHNPANITCIEIAQKLFTQTPHYAVFDTAFHQTMPTQAYTYAIDSSIAQNYGIRRYGFHGSNHHYVAQQAAEFLNKPLQDCQFISLHLGNGASSCLIKQGISQDTSMGMTPLSGLVMGTRSGDIDPGILLFLANQGFQHSEIDELLNKKSGLKGLCGYNDMRKIEQLAIDGDKSAKEAIELFCYRIQQYIGAYYSQTPKLDAVIFTGGIGENSANIRVKTLEKLKHLGLEINPSLNEKKANTSCHNIAAGKIPILVVKGDEELFMANQVQNLLGDTHIQ